MSKYYTFICALEFKKPHSMTNRDIAQKLLRIRSNSTSGTDEITSKFARNTKRISKNFVFKYACWGKKVQQGLVRPSGCCWIMNHSNTMEDSPMARRGTPIFHPVTEEPGKVVLSTCMEWHDFSCIWQIIFILRKRVSIVI